MKRRRESSKEKRKRRRERRGRDGGRRIQHGSENILRKKEVEDDSEVPRCSKAIGDASDTLHKELSRSTHNRLRTYPTTIGSSLVPEGKVESVLPRLVSLLEVKLDIFQMDGNKAPGPDGLIPLLFQKYREILQVPLWRELSMILALGDGEEENEQRQHRLRSSAVGELREVHVMPSDVVVSQIISRVKELTQAWAASLTRVSAVEDF
ncbi:hypothetical protein M9H77_27162 [Catharanthus roseus]|uniref:Uncharacterized protein n=1 Tax=Catharanthus roseus TaxID=4058 RepID=A0ACC0ACL3_CATRO|nr:hypothetical protein M9H77_27162 [Catharanthus roseus]